MEREKEDNMNTRWVGSMRTNNYGAMLLQTSANLIPATVWEFWSGWDGLFLSHFFLSQSVTFTFRWWEV